MIKINSSELGGESLPPSLASKLSSLPLSSGPQTPARNARSIICLTGKMAAGKNYVCSLLEKHGWLSIDADLLVHKAIEQATPKIVTAFSEIAARMKIALTNSDGSINRRNLGKIVFTDPALLKKQEEIVYPVITQMIEDFLDVNQDKKIIINATVLYKTPDLMEKCSAIVFVTASCVKRLVRARRRDKMPLRHIIKRFASQKQLLKEYKKTGKEILIVRN